jgi:hypothetical protein
MKTVGILTRHFISNYGSLFQAYALENVVTSLGYKTYIINYIPEEEKIKNDANLCVLRNHLKGLKAFVYKLVIPPFHKYTARLFEKFRRQYLDCSQEYSESTIKECKYDVYLSGSDQIWGPIGTKTLDKNYFLDFTSSPNKVAYSSSFGFSDFNLCDKGVLKDLLIDYKSISVREESALKFIDSLGLHAKLVLDPVFLLPKDVYLKLANAVKIRKKDYILVYQLHHTSIALEFAKKIARENNLKIKIITTNMARYIPFQHINYISNPNQFLAYINDAKLVITDSFHVTAFSIIFNKQFFSVNPGKTAARVIDLLQLLALDDRYVPNFQYTAEDKIIDFNEVNNKLQKMISDSKETLIEELNQCNN